MIYIYIYIYTQIQNQLIIMFQSIIVYHAYESQILDNLKQLVKAHLHDLNLNKFTEGFLDQSPEITRSFSYTRMHATMCTVHIVADIRKNCLYAIRILNFELGINAMNIQEIYRNKVNITLETSCIYICTPMKVHTYICNVIDNVYFLQIFIVYNNYSL